MRILAALGGNALRGRGDAPAATAQRGIADAARALGALAADHELVAITHGNRPRVGYTLALALRNVLPDRDLLRVLPAVVIGGDDHLRSPEPQAIVETRSLRALVEAGVIVICGGKVPVTLNRDGAIHGAEAVVDEDLTASLLARRLEADLLLMLTDVDAVLADWGTEGERALADTSPAELRGQSFAATSIGPKVEAACRFVDATGGRAAIGDLRMAVEVARGASGTQVSSDATLPWPR